MTHNSQMMIKSYVIIQYQQQIRFSKFEHKIKLFVQKHFGSSTLPGKYELS